MRKSFILAASVFLWLAAAVPAARAASAVPAPASTVALWRIAKGVSVPDREFPGFAGGFIGGSLAAGDLGIDGIREVIVGAASGGKPFVRIFRADGSMIFEFQAFDAAMRQGVNVAVGDVDGDGTPDIVVGTGPGVPAEARVFDNFGKRKTGIAALFPYGKNFTGGVNLAAADLNGDGIAEIVTGAGPGGGPHVSAWKAEGGTRTASFFAFGTGDRGGVSVAAGDLDGDGRAEIVAAPAGGTADTVAVFSSGDGMTFAEARQFVIGQPVAGGLSVAIGDADGEGTPEIAVAPNGTGSHVGLFNASGEKEAEFDAAVGNGGGVAVAIGPFDPASLNLVAALPLAPPPGRPSLAKFISVDIAKQRLQAYEYGRLVKTFLVSTGVKKYPTPIGDFSVLSKPEFVNYRWSYGPNNPDNYDLGRVRWNLLFSPHIYIHYAPWHNNFGRRVSHGCVNVNKKNAAWIFGWADVGTPVSVKE